MLARNRYTTIASIVFAMLIPIGASVAKEVVLAVIAFGTGNDADQNNARSYAKDAAEASLTCVGSLQNTRVVINSCSKSGDDSSPEWTCTATATAKCAMGR